jgi:hypothetical protein
LGSIASTKLELSIFGFPGTATIGLAVERFRKHLFLNSKFMDELINLVVQKTGISQDDARKAVEVIVNELKSRLPAPIASHVDAFIAGGMSGGANTLASEAGEMLKGKLGGLFGGQG